MILAFTPVTTAPKSSLPALLPPVPEMVVVPVVPPEITPPFSTKTPVCWPDGLLPPRPITLTTPAPVASTAPPSMSTPTKLPEVGVACSLANRVMSPLEVDTTAPLLMAMFKAVEAENECAPKLELPLKLIGPAPALLS